jgi:hypothetical protein
MEFIVKWKPVGGESVRTLNCQTEKGAEQWAFARLRDGVSEIWIEDSSGRVIIGGEEVRRRWQKHGPS